MLFFKRVLKAAGRLGLGNNASDLHNMVKGRDFVRLAAGMVRIELEDDYKVLEK